MQNTTDLDGYNPFGVAFDEITSEKAALWYRQQLIGVLGAAGSRSKDDSLILWGWAIQALVFVATGACRGAKGVGALAVGNVRSQCPQAWKNTAALLQGAAGLFSGSTEGLHDTAPAALNPSAEPETSATVPDTSGEETSVDLLQTRAGEGIGEETGNSTPDVLNGEGETPSLEHLQSLGVRELRGMAKSHGATIPDVSLSRATKAQLVAALANGGGQG